MTTLNLTALNQISRYGLLNGDWSPTGAWSLASLTLANTALRLLDTVGDHYLNVVMNENLTANRVLNLDTGDSDRTITLSGNPTLGDWFNQSVKTTASPTFVGLNLSSTQLIDLTADVVGQRIQASAGHTVALQTWETSGGVVMSSVSQLGYFGIGASPLAGRMIRVSKVFNTVTETMYGVTSELETTVAANHSLYGLFFAVKSSHGTGTTFTNLYGVNGEIRLTAGGNVTLATGGKFLIRHSSWGTLATGKGCDVGVIINGAGVLTSYQGVYVSAPTVSSGNSIVNLYGLYVEDQNVAYTLNYAIYTNRGDVRLMSSAADKLGFHGTAPAAQQLLATGAGATVDNVITMLQNIGLCRQV